jgi:hypothetical protein
MQNVTLAIALIGADPDSRLSEKEIERMFFYCFEAHDHQARAPQPCIYWHRSQSKDIWEFLN